MPADTERQRGFMALVREYKDTGRMPTGAGGRPLSKETQANVRRASKSMTRQQVVDFMRKK